MRGKPSLRQLDNPPAKLYEPRFDELELATRTGRVVGDPSPDDNHEEFWGVRDWE